MQLESALLLSCYMLSFNLYIIIFINLVIEKAG